MSGAKPRHSASPPAITPATNVPCPRLSFNVSSLVQFVRSWQFARFWIKSNPLKTLFQVTQTSLPKRCCYIYTTLGYKVSHFDTLILRKCGWLAWIPVSNMAILTFDPVYPLAQRASAPNNEVTWDLWKN